MAEEEDDDYQTVPLALSRNSHLFLAVHAPSEFDDEEEAEGRLGATLYVALRNNATLLSSKIKHEESKYLGPVSVETLAPMIVAARKHGDLFFDSLIRLRFVTGETPPTESKTWKKRRTEQLRRLQMVDLNKGDPASFLETAFAEGTIHGFLTASLLLLEYPPSFVLRLGPIASQGLGIPLFMGTDHTTCEYILSKVLKRVSDSASEFAARRCLGEKLEMPPPRGIKSHPMTFLLFEVLLTTFKQKLESVTDPSKEMSDALMYAARALAINLWYLHLSNIMPGVVGMGTSADAGEPPHLTLASQCNEAEIHVPMALTLLDLANKLRNSEQTNRAGFEECAFAWGAGFFAFVPENERRLSMLMDLLQQPCEAGDGTHYILENLCARISLFPTMAKQLPIHPTIELLMESMQRTWTLERPASGSLSKVSSLPMNPPSGDQTSNAPLSPASSTGGGSVYSIVSSRKRGDEDDEEEDATDELASISGQTKARSIGTNSVASSLIAVAEEVSSQHGEDQIPGLISARSIMAQPSQQQQPASKSSLKSISLDISTIEATSLGANSNLAATSIVPSSTNAPEVVRPQYLRHYQRLRLLMLLQGICMVQNPAAADESASALNEKPSNTLVYDEPRCAETIQILMDGRKAVQKADKKWGTAISTMPMNLSLGEVFQWRVRVDKCEGGHIVFGVATREAPSSSYLGEDSNGWGFIGKGHLWHNREKKGSFGEIVRTGDTLTITLDCKKGTLSYANTLKDFGVAFRGLREFCQGDSCLYPAVALYEKGDTVTLLPASVPGDETCPLELGITRGLFWSFHDGPSVLDRTMCALDRSLVSLTFPPSEDYVSHLETLLARFSQTTSPEQVLMMMAPLSTFCLWPINRISSSLALRLIPQVLNALKWCVQCQSSQTVAAAVDVSGKWWFHDSSATKHQVDFQQQIVSTSISVSCTVVKGTLQSKREGQVKVTGEVRGSSLVLVEHWKQGLRYVKMRLMPDSRVAIGWHQSEYRGSVGSSSPKPMWAIRMSSASDSRRPASHAMSNAVKLLSELIGKLSYVLTFPGNESDDSTTTTSSVTAGPAPSSMPSSTSAPSATAAGSNQSSPEQRWANSDLFVAHKSNQADLDALLERVEREDSTLRDLLKEQLVRSDGSISDLKDVLLETGSDDFHSTSRSSSQTIVHEDEQLDREFLVRFIDGECADLDHWLLRFAGQAALVAKGGASIASVRRHAIACFLLHSGVVREARLIDRYFSVRSTSSPLESGVGEQTEEEEALRTATPVVEEDSVDESVERVGVPHPSVMLVNVWRAGTRVVTWAIREKQTQNVSYEVVSEPLLEKAKLLLLARPKHLPRLEYVDVGRPLLMSSSSSTTTTTTTMPSTHISEKELVVRALDEWKRAARTNSRGYRLTHTESLDPLVAFFTDRQLSVEKLRSIFTDRAFKALLRCAGFNACRRGLEVLSTSGFEEDGARACLIQWLPASTFACRQSLPLDAEPSPQMSELVQPVVRANQQMPLISPRDYEDLGLIPSARVYVRPAASERASCLFGLDGCGGVPRMFVKKSFEQLYSALGQMLPGSSFNANDIDTGSVLDVWTLPLREEEDFALVLRSNLLVKLKQVLDHTRSSIVLLQLEEEGASVPEQARLGMRANQTVLLNCLRLIGSLAHQIVTDYDEDSDAVESPSRNELVGLIFEMGLEELRTIVSRTTIAPMSNLEEPFAYHLLQLLFATSVNGPQTSGKFMTSSSEWVSLLLQLSKTASSPRILQRCFRLLGRILQQMNDTSVEDDSLVELVPKDLMDRIRSAFPVRRTISESNPSFSTQAMCASECISLMRKLIATSSGEETKWTKSCLEVITDYLTSSEDHGKVWAGLAVLGGYYEPLRLLGLVRLTAASAADFESVLAANSSIPPRPNSPSNDGLSNPMVGVVVSTPDSKCHVVVPSLFTGSTLGGAAGAAGDDNDGSDVNQSMSGSATLGDDGRGMRLIAGRRSSSNSGGGRMLSSVSCDRVDLVPVSDAKVPKMLLQRMIGHIVSLFDAYMLPASTASSSSSSTTSSNGEIESAAATEKAPEGIQERASKAMIKASLGRMLPSLILMPDFLTHVLSSSATISVATSRLKVLLEKGIRPTETLGLSDIHHVCTWWRHLSDSMYTRPTYRPPPPVVPTAAGGGSGSGGGGDATTASSVTPPPSGTSSSISPIPPPPGQTTTPDPFSLDEPPSPVLQELLSLDLGFPRELCIVALDRCGSDVEAAIHYCLEHAGDAETVIEEYRWQRANRPAGRQGSSASTPSAADAEQRRKTMIIDKLKEMGFSHTWCVKALDAVHNEGFNQALTWLLANGDALSEQDEMAEKLAKAQKEDAQNMQQQAQAIAALSPEEAKRRARRLVCMSGGQATTHITPELQVFVRPVTGNPGFPTVMCRNLLLDHGRWYYEVTIETEMCMQIGWADACFTGDSLEGTGVGDDAHSWAYDGYRKLKWHQQSTSWGKQWKAGDVVGCAVDLNAGEMWFSLNGNWEENMGLCFKGLVRGLTYIDGLAPAASFNRSERMRFNFGPTFKHTAGPYVWASTGGMARPVCDAFESTEFNVKYRRMMRTRKCKEEGSLFVTQASDKFEEVVEDCFEESIGDALSDRYFSHGQFASTSMLARRSSSGASGPMGIQSSLGLGGGATNPFFIREPFPRACSLTNMPSGPMAALDELIRVEKTSAGDLRVCEGLERACETLITLYSRAACLFALLVLDKLDETQQQEIRLGLTEAVPMVWKLIKTCSGKFSIGDVIAAVDHTENLAWYMCGKEDVLASLQVMARKLIADSEESAKSLFDFLLNELSLACSRPYSAIPWDDFNLSNPLVVHSLWTVAMDDQSSPMSEVKLLEHPSVLLASWATEVLRTQNIEQDKRLVFAWAMALRAPGTRIKIVACRELLSFLSPDADPDVDETVAQWVDCVIEKSRIKDIAGRLMSRSGTVSLQAVPSKYALAMAELGSLL